MTSSVKQNYKAIAKRWASALMELANEDANISKDDVLKNLKDIVDTINSSQELINVINNPSVTTEEKQTIISKIFHINIVYLKQKGGIFSFLYKL